MVDLKMMAYFKFSLSACN